MNKVYCAYTPSEGAIALLNKISVFRISLSLLSCFYLRIGSVARTSCYLCMAGIRCVRLYVRERGEKEERDGE